MKIYVKSRGASRSHEYEWINQSQQEDEPSIINHSFSESGLTKEVRITDLHNLDQPAIIVLREGLNLLILLTGIKAGWNAPGGAVYHSVAWLSCEEKDIRALAIHALKGELQHNVISAITSLDSKPGFEVDFSKLKRFDFGRSLSLGEQSKSFETGKLAKNISELRDELANELVNVCLPKEGTFLIVVSDFVSESFLKNVDVWRGLTSRLKQHNWVEFDLKKNSLPIHLPSPPISQPIPGEATMQPGLVRKPTQVRDQTKMIIWGLGLLMIGILVGLTIAFAFLGAKLPSVPVKQPLQENQTLNPSNQGSRKIQPSPENQAPMNQQILYPSYQSHQGEQIQPILQKATP
jgi:hypothetical protein